MSSSLQTVSIAKSLQIESVYLLHLEAPLHHRSFPFRLEPHPSTHYHWPLMTLPVVLHLSLPSLFEFFFHSPSFISNLHLLLVLESLLPSPQNLFLILHRLVKPFTSTSILAPALWLLETWSCILFFSMSTFPCSLTRISKSSFLDGKIVDRKSTETRLRRTVRIKTDIEHNSLSSSSPPTGFTVWSHFPLSKYDIQLDCEFSK